MPALRWEFYKDWWVVMGIDVPLTGLRPTTKCGKSRSAGSSKCAT